MVEMNKKTIAKINSTIVAEVCKKNNITSLSLFGSYARGDFTPQSDMDMLVRFSKPKSLLDLVRIERELANRLGKPVDLVTEDAVSPYLKETIKSNLKLIYEQKG